MLRFVKSKSGTAAAEFDGIYLNSRYNPVDEARKIVAEKLSGVTPEVVVVLGETLGYLSQAVIERAPDCRCVQVYYDDQFYDRCGFLSAVNWHPGIKISFDVFFRSVIHELEIENLSVIEWAPAAKAYPEVANEALAALRRTIGVYNGNVGTTVSFGRRWLRNTVQNYLITDNISQSLGRTGLVVVAASGPTLEESLDVLSAKREDYYLIALPSALCALFDRGLEPDLLVITDPGYYSGEHLKPTRRKMMIAMPYTAVRVASRFASKVVLLNQGTYLENELVAQSGVPYLRLEQIGTVAGTALLIAAIIGSSVVFAGLDLVNRDLQTHARPHAFDPLFEIRSKRFLPVQTVRYLRSFANALNAKSSEGIGALGTYAQWFNTVTSAPDIRLYRLNPSPVELGGMIPLDPEGFSSLCMGKRREQVRGSGSEQRVESPSVIPVGRRKTILLSILAELKDTVRSAHPRDRKDFTEATPLSTIYFASPRSLLKSFKTPGSGDFEEAVTATVQFVEQLEGYVDLWPV